MLSFDSTCTWESSAAVDLPELLQTFSSQCIVTSAHRFTLFISHSSAHTGTLYIAAKYDSHKALTPPIQIHRKVAHNYSDKNPQTSSYILSLPAKTQSSPHSQSATRTKTRIRRSPNPVYSAVCKYFQYAMPSVVHVLTSFHRNGPRISFVGSASSSREGLRERNGYIQVDAPGRRLHTTSIWGAVSPRAGPMTPRQGSKAREQTKKKKKTAGLGPVRDD